MPIEIRKPKVEEWEQFKELRLKSLHEYPLAFASSYDEQLDKSNEEWKSYILASETEKDSVMFCAYEDGQMIGCVSGIWNNRKKVSHIVSIVGMFVFSDKQNKGVGYKLVTTLLDYLHKKERFHKAKLSVVSSNLPAHNLYKKVGFVDAGVLHAELFIDGKYHDFIEMERFF
jgi:RimJ/RimL family protein N-acetyltransferase